MEKILHNITENTDIVDIQPLKQLVKKLRPGIFRSKKVAIKRVDKLIELLRENEAYQKGLNRYLNTIFSSGDSHSLLTESGILSSEGFFSESFRKIAHIFLPPVPQENVLRDAINMVFNKKSDYVWFKTIPTPLLEELLILIFQHPVEENKRKNFVTLLNAVEILIHRVTAIGLDAEIIKRHPDLLNHDSPFLVVNKEVIDLLQNIESSDSFSIDTEKLKRCVTLIKECDRVAKKIRDNQHSEGASLALTYLLQRMHQHLIRILTLLEILSHFESKEKWKPISVFLKNIVQYENKKNSIKELFLKNIGFLAFQITEHTGKTGEHYITNNKKEYVKMLYSAMGGGFIVAFLTWFKAAIYYLKLAPFGESFLYSMNYSFGFIGIHLTHSTLATKQPAMTASKIAASLDIKGSVEEAIKNLSALIVKTFRSQFVAFVGNMFVAFPVAIVIAIIYYWIAGSHILGDAKAFKIIENLHPWESFSLMHGAIAGLCLFLSGVISGYYDNAVMFQKIPERLKHQPFLKFIMPKSWLNKLSRYIENNLGSLAGNFFLGIFLGSMGTLGHFLGLPIDIQHVTFASGNFGLSLVSVGTQIDFMTFLHTVIGIIGVGFMNFIVSFGLAIFIAIQSRRVAFNKTGLLLKYLFVHLFTRPLDFLFPPEDKTTEEVTEELENEALKEKTED